MTRRSKVWLVVAVLFTLGNFAGGVYALVLGELLHTVTHAGLVLLGAYWVRHLWRRAGETEIPAEFHEFTDRLTHVEQSVDAVAIELERIGEGQRFITRLFTENATKRAPGEGAAEPIEIKAR
jgi:hypothetical protein